MEMRSSADPTRFGALLIAFLLLAPIQAARAEDDADESSSFPGRRALLTTENLQEHERLTQEWYEAQLERAFERFLPKPDRQVLLGVADDDAPTKSLLPGRFRINLKRGLEYRQKFSVGPQQLRLKVYGPIVKGNPGLRLKLDGLMLRDLPVEIEAFGNPEKGGLEFKIDF
jgi:hypothetical protein